MADDNKERVLTKAEQRRYDRFLVTCSEMEKKGYTRKDLVIDLNKANLYIGLVSIPFIALSIYLFWKINRSLLGRSMNGILYVVLLLVLTVIHELIHGLSWSLFCGNGWKDIEFGFIVKTMNPYCTCATPLPRDQYIIGALAPLFILGIVPYIAGLFAGSFPVFFMGAVMILGAGGDIMLVSKLLAFRPDGDAEEVIIYDHPTEAGSVAFYK